MKETARDETEDWGEDHASARLTTHEESQLPICAIEATIEDLAASRPDDLSDDDRTYMVGHAAVCPTCAVIIKDYEEINDFLLHFSLNEEEDENCENDALPELPPHIFRPG